MAQLTPFLAQDLQEEEDNKLRSTALFMCATCRHELYREFDLKILTECCAEAIRGPNNEPGSRHASATLAVRALAKTLSCAYHFPPEGEDEGGPPDGGTPANADALVDGEHEDKGVCKRAHDKQDLLD